MNFHSNIGADVGVLRLARLSARIQAVDFDWDPRKAKENERKHDVSVLEAAMTLGDELGVTFRIPITPFTNFGS